MLAFLSALLLWASHVRGENVVGVCINGDVRLVNGPTPFEGRVEFCHNGEWGTVCDDRWSRSNVRVVCRQLGLPTNALVFQSFGEGSGPILLDGVQCTGNESTLSQCFHVGIGNHDCVHREDVGVRCLAEPECNNTIVRLLGGTSLSEGRVEYCDGVWGTVCDDDWDRNDAVVVCRQLGLPTEFSLAYQMFGGGSGPILLDDVNCTGGESSLSQCPHNGIQNHNCHHIEDAGVSCLADPQCTDTEVRLAGGSSQNEGKIEYCEDGTWNSVCFTTWNRSDTLVLCRQLGLPTQLTLQYEIFGEGFGPILSKDFQCTGSESSLSQCIHTDIDIHECLNVGGHVTCLAEPQCSDTDIRLVGGSNSNEGRVEYCDNGIWGTVCDDNWRAESSLVVCSQLGLPTEYAYAERFGGGTGPILLDEVRCTGEESKLSQCHQNDVGDHDCNHHEDIGVQCLTEPRCSDFDVRLVEGSTPFMGIVQVCESEDWNTICAEGWDTADASVVCRQLGFASKGAVSGRSFVGFYTSLMFDAFACNGSEEHILNCDRVRIQECSAGEATVLCRARECNETDVRLAEGQTPYDGGVEICLNGLWGRVCDDLWDAKDATVVCRQLGYEGPSYAVHMYPGRVSGLFSHLNGVSCSGIESMLCECDYKGADCSIHENAAVICTGPTCEEGSIRLVGSYNIKEGRVEYCSNNTWYSICADSWQSAEARAVCSTLGYSTDLASVVSSFGEGSSPILPQYFQCSRGEGSLSECNTSSSDITQCQHVAGVICEAPCISNGIVDCSICDGVSGCQAIDATPCQCGVDCYSSGTCCPDVLHVQNCLVPPRGETPCVTGEVRLTGGVTNSSSGRLEVCVSGVWGSVCDYHRNWGQGNAAVVCRQLGFPSSGASVVPTAVFGPGNGPVFLDEVQCSGVEDGLIQCAHAGFGNHVCGQAAMQGKIQSKNEFDVAIRCKDDCLDGEVRLQDGTAPSNGRVEVCQNGIWGSVCTDQWDDTDASVVCRQLGYDPNDGIATDVFGPGGGDVVYLSDVQCTGLEAELTLCPHVGLGQLTCTRQNSTGVICGNSAPMRCEYDDDGLPVVQASIAGSGRFGVCEPYKEGVEVCNQFLSSVDNVFITKSHGSQENISQFLNSNIPFSLLSRKTDYCREQGYRIVCNYYFIPCGSESSALSPSPICPEECSMVETACPSAWTALQLGLSDYRFISCNDTSAFLFPLPNCCTGVGIQEEVQTSSSTPDTVAGVVVGSLLLAASILLVVMIIVFLQWRKRRRLKNPQSDVIPNPGLVGDEGFHETELRTDYSLSSTEPSGSSYAQVNRARIKTHYLRQMTQSLIIRHERLTLLENIGQGEFGIVYKAILAPNNNNFGSEIRVAVKTLKGYFNQSQVDKILEESLKMKTFKHRHIMSLIGVCVDSGPAPYIVMPYMANGSLLSYLKRERRSLMLNEEAHEEEVKEVKKCLMVMCLQIADGMEYLAGERFVHRDLAARNCMIDFNYQIKITDFGLTEDVYAKNYFRQGSSSEVVKLPVKWMAPESLLDGYFTEKSDVWSYGVTMWEILSGGTAPYPGVGPHTLIELFEAGHRLNKPTNAACNDVIYGWMIECWKYTPEDRPSFKTLHGRISNYVEKLAGYLEVDFNPFKGRGSMSSVQEEGQEDTSDSETEIRVYPPSLTV